MKKRRQGERSTSGKEQSSTINESFFFRNTNCYYFPCHQCESDEDFNCLFCFCPLYFLTGCGGRPIMRGKIKDCSNCDMPHRPGGYEHVIERLTKNRTLKNKSI